MSQYRGAAKLYLQALQSFEREPEVAYLYLITAGEILPNFSDFDKDDPLDEETKGLLDKIRTHMPNGVAVANQVTGRLLLIKKRSVRAITGLVDPCFFERSESRKPAAKLVPGKLEAAISAAYDLRSRYVHTGAPFGLWVSLPQAGAICPRPARLPLRSGVPPRWPPPWASPDSRPGCPGRGHQRG